MSDSTSSSNDSVSEIFICHDTNDLNSIARPLYDALIRKGINPWLYSEKMKGGFIGPELHRGIMDSRSSVIIVTQNFLKNTKSASLEFTMILQKAATFPNGKHIFSIWDGVTSQEVSSYHLLLGAVDGIQWKLGIEEASDELITRYRKGLSNG